jgi:DNA uptake protein ComE-like DNA-binding protein
MILLLAILLPVLFAPFFINRIFPEPEPSFSIKEIPADALAATEADEVLPAYNAASFFTFNPNTATNAQLRKLGFTERNIKSLRKYQSKGGRLRKREDILKLYGLSMEHKQALLPFVVIDDYPAWMQDTASAKKKYASLGIVDLNSADSATLVALRGIGPKTAKRIVDYRNKLGGFVKVEQLTELWGFDPDVLYDLKDQIMLDVSKVTLYNVNTVVQDELKQHPYFKYKLSQAIVNYRLQHGPYRQLEDLRKIVLVNDSVYQRIILYLYIP